jgi:hypothetical protein
MSLHPTIIALRGLSRIDENNHRICRTISLSATFSRSIHCCASEVPRVGSSILPIREWQLLVLRQPHTSTRSAKNQESRSGDRCLTSQNGLSTNAKANECSLFRDKDIRRPALFHDKPQYWYDAHSVSIIQCTIDHSVNSSCRFAATKHNTDVCSGRIVQEAEMPCQLKATM